MNKFMSMENKKQGLELGDIVQWTENGNFIQELMIFKDFNNKIGLVNLRSATTYDKPFNDIKDLEKYLLNKKVQDNEIYVLYKSDWTVYVP